MYAVPPQPHSNAEGDQRQTMSSAPPVPQQWWDQENGDKGPNSTHNNTNNMVSPTNRNMPPTYGSPLDTLSPANAPTPEIRNLSNPIDRPSLRSPSPTIQKRLENAAPSTFRGAYGNFQNYNTTSSPSHRQNFPVHRKPEQVENTEPTSKPSSTGLIRLTLNKPMGIVFEPMTDPHNSSQQRGVRICDLPRTGAAALSRKLEVGDELLSINNKTVSRLTFDEIMDIIIEANPEAVNLLFRRPRKEQLTATSNQATIPTGPAAMIQKTNSRDQRTGVKWIDGKDGSQPLGDEKKKVKISERKKKSRSEKDDESTMTGESRHTLEQMDRDHRRDRRRRSNGKSQYENESFLDMLIDSFCAPIIGNDRRKDEFWDDDDATFYSQDDSTYVTYEEEPKSKKKSKSSSKSERGRGKKRNEKYGSNDDDDDGTLEDQGGSMDDNSYTRKGITINNSLDKGLGANASSLSKSTSQENDNDMIRTNHIVVRPSTSDVIYEEPGPLNVYGKYEDDVTLETVETMERAKALSQQNIKQDKMSSPPPLGLMPQQRSPHSPRSPHSAQSPAEKSRSSNKDLKGVSIKVENDNSTLVQDKNIPISELEYDQFDHGADVSVMESVGGPSLLLEARRHNAAVNAGAQKASTFTVDADIMAQYGLDYPTDLGSTREETIQRDPAKFYLFVVKGLLQDNEPEKVRLLDKLLTKYKGREPHLIQKLSARYDRKKETDSTVKEKEVEEESQTADKIDEPQNKNDINDNDGFQNFGAFPRVTSKDVKNAFDAWPPMEDNNDPNKSSSMDEDIQVNKESDDVSHSSYTESDFSGDSIDGTSPAVIAQVSELLNYVYGKTSVPGQIDRVSTIMRAYEGREAILLELLETKALLKANEDKEAANNLPAALRNNPALQKRQNANDSLDADNPTISSPVSGITTTYSDEKDVEISSSSVGRTAGTSISTPSPSSSNKSKVRQLHFYSSFISSFYVISKNSLLFILIIE